MRLPSAGDLDRLLEFQYQDSTQDAVYGTPVVDWKPHAQVWAQVQDALPSRAERDTGNISVSSNQSTIRVRWRDDIDSAMRIVDLGTGAVFQIIGGPAMLGRRQFAELQCERHGALTDADMFGDVILLDDRKPLLLDRSDFVTLRL